MKRVESLTFLRFIAALIVVIFHFGQKTWIVKHASPFIVAGPQMVSLFFVLSGFVLTIAHYNKNNERLRDYYVARIARIVPIYMIALLISVYFEYGKGNNNKTALLLNLTFLQSWFPPYPLTLNNPAWSLSVEAFFYLAFPAILFIIKKGNISWKTLTILSVLFYFFTQAILSNLLNNGFYTGYPSASHDLIYYFPLSHFCSFLLGISGGLIYAKHPEWFNKTGFMPFIILMAVILANYFALQKPEILVSLTSVPFAYGASFYSLLFLLLIMSFAYSKSIITTIMSLPFLVLLGEASYSLYILQAPMNTIYTKFISSRLSLGIEANFYLFVFLLIMISIVSFYLIEKPGKRFIQNINAYMYKRKNKESVSLG